MLATSTDQAHQPQAKQGERRRLGRLSANSRIGHGRKANVKRISHKRMAVDRIGSCAEIRPSGVRAPEVRISWTWDSKVNYDVIGL